MNSKKMFCLFVIGLCFLLSLSIVTAAEKKGGEVICRMASHMSSRDASGMALQKFADLLEAKSNGRFKTSVANDGKLGSQREVVEQVRDSALEVTISLAGGPGFYAEELMAIEYPYTYKDDDHMVRVLKAMRPEVEKILAPYNFKPFGYMDIGFRHILNKKRPIYKPDDLKGIKVRAPAPFYADMLTALGASSTIITWTEVYTALQSGVVDGVEASASLLYAMKFHEQAKYLSKTYHIGANFYIMAGKKWFDNLPKDLQAIFVQASEEASQYQVDLQKKLDKEYMDKLVAEGTKANEVESVDEFRNKVVAWRNEYVKKQGPKTVAFYEKMLQVK
jgi:tripartite ATP-independent transporter DctP family solute receptor